jgi:hypothetical protein
MSASFSEDWFLEFYQDLIEFMNNKENNFLKWGDVLHDQLHEFYVANPHGDMTRWKQSYDLLPNVQSLSHDLNTSALTFNSNDLSEQESQDKLMMASWHGGMSIAYSQVGVAHALSYGLSYLLGVKHGIGNCIVFDHLEEYYPDGVALFKEMKVKHNIFLPQGICKDLSDKEFDIMINVALSLEPLWENAIGKQWKKTITREKLKALYQKM